MGMTFLVLFAIAEITLVVLTFTKFGKKFAWLKNYFKDIPLLGEIPHVQKAELNNLGKYIDSKILTEIL